MIAVFSWWRNMRLGGFFRDCPEYKTRGIFPGLSGIIRLGWWCSLYYDILKEYETRGIFPEFCAETRSMTFLREWVEGHLTVRFFGTTVVDVFLGGGGGGGWGVLCEFVVTRVVFGEVCCWWSVSLMKHVIKPVEVSEWRGAIYFSEGEKCGRLYVRRVS